MKVSDIFTRQVVAAGVKRPLFSQHALQLPCDIGGDHHFRKVVARALNRQQLREFALRLS